MKAVFDHSWNLLSTAEQRVFAGSSIFRGGFTREAAAQVAGATLPILAALVDNSLLDRAQQNRFVVHELARQYAADRLADVQQVTEIRHRHLQFFARFAEVAEPNLRSGRFVSQWCEYVEHEHDNLRAALEWALNGGEITLGLRIVGALWEFWMHRGYAYEGFIYAERFLARPGVTPDSLEWARTLHTAGVLAFYQGHFPDAHAFLRRSTALSRQLGRDGGYVLSQALVAQSYTLAEQQLYDAAESVSQEILSIGRELQDSHIQGHALRQFGDVAQSRGNIEFAQQCYSDSFECFQADGNSVMRGSSLTDSGMLYYKQGDITAAKTYMTRSLAIFEELGDAARASRALVQLAILAAERENDNEAQELLTKALISARKIGNVRYLTSTLEVAGRLAQRQGDPARAQALLRECLTLRSEMNHPPRIARALDSLACLAAWQGHPEKAIRLFGAAVACFPVIDEILEPIWRSENSHWLAAARAELGEGAYAAAWAVGAAMELEQTIDYALELPTSPVIKVQS